MDPLRHRFLHAVFNARRVAVIHKAGRNPRRHSRTLVHLPQQDSAGVRTDTTAIKPAGHQATPQGREIQVALRYTVSSGLLPLWLA